MMSRLLIFAFVLAGAARAQPTRLDLVRGPVISTSRITGLGGAFAGVAVGIDGVPLNPAALGHRSEASADWFDWDLGFGFLFVPGREADLDGDGLAPGALSAERGAGLEFQAYNTGMLLQLGAFGLGAYADFYGWTSGRVQVRHTDGHVGVGLALFDGHLVLGGASLSSSVDISEVSGGSLFGVVPAFGLLLRPPSLPLAFGARFRPTNILRTDDRRSDLVGVVPWQLGLGVSYRMTADGRPYNAPHRAAPRVTDPRYLLFAADLVLTGPAHGVTLEGLVGRALLGELTGPRVESGLATSLGLHLGAEGEVIANRLRARVGTYFEPLRVADEGAFRLHLTGGVELRLIELIFNWKLNVSCDLSPGWQNLSFGVGIW